MKHMATPSRPSEEGETDTELTELTVELVGSQFLLLETISGWAQSL